MAKVITTQDAAFTAFTQATQHAQSRANAAEAERAATEAARLALPTQVAAATGPAIAAAQAAANLAAQRAGVVGSVPNDAALAGRAAGDYRIGTEIVSWNGAAITSRTGVLANAAQLPRQDNVLRYGLSGGTWDSAVTQAVASVGPGGIVHFPQTAAGDAAYALSSLDPLAGLYVSADPGVILRVPTMNGRTARDVAWLTPMDLQVEDRPQVIHLVPTAPAAGLDWLARLAGGDIRRRVGALGPATSIDGTTLARWRRNTATGARTAGVATLSTSGATWPPNTFSTTASTIEVVGIKAPAVGTRAHACLANGSGYGRIGVLVEAGSDFIYLNTDEARVYRGRFSAGNPPYVDTQAQDLPTAAYSSAAPSAQATYSFWVVDEHTVEVFINSSLFDRYVFSQPITAAGWGAYHTANDGFAITVRDPVREDVQEAHLGRPISVLVVGDSVSAAEGLSRGWVDLMQTLLEGTAGIGKVTITNLAVSGETAAQQRARLESHGAAGCDVVLIVVSINDQQQYRDPELVRADLDAMTLLAQTAGALPVLGVPHVYIDQRVAGQGFASSNYAQAGRYHSVIRRVAAARGALVADFEAALGLIDPSTAPVLTRDNLHPSQQYGAVAYAREAARAVAAAVLPRAVPATAAPVTPTPTPTPSSGRTTVRRTFVGAGTVTVQLPPGVVDVRAGWVWDGTIRSLQVISAISQVSGTGGEAKWTHVAPDPQLSAALSTSGLLSLSSTVNMPGYVDVTYEVWMV